MSDEKTYTEKEWHKKTAVDAFNACWDLIDKKDRTLQEDLEMIRRAHVSRWHWQHVGEPKNFAAGDWQCSRVYAILGRGEPALIYAKESLRECEEGGVTDFNLPFAHEACARAYAALGDRANFEKHYAEAKRLGETIEEKDDRDYFFQDLEAGNWFGMK
ncbi:MAG: hypothetical protein HRF49_01225 [bacterium]|jgi:hypothetical protein